MVEVLSQARVGHLTRFVFVHHDQCISWFQKEKWGFTACETHLFGMLFVIATDAVNASDWKTFSLT
jgi:hypothetical protein